MIQYLSIISHHTQEVDELIFEKKSSNIASLYKSFRKCLKISNSMADLNRKFDIFPTFLKRCFFDDEIHSNRYSFLYVIQKVMNIVIGLIY